MKIVHVETGKEASSQKWNLAAIAELVVGFPEGDMDSDYSKNWVCACHHLPLGEDPEGYGFVMCKLEADKVLEEVLRQ